MAKLKELKVEEVVYEQLRLLPPLDETELSPETDDSPKEYDWMRVEVARHAGWKALQQSQNSNST